MERDIAEDTMKLYITGPVGSGKTTLSERVAARLMIPCVHLDDVVYVRNRTAGGWGNSKRPPEETEALFLAELAKDAWVMEDAGRALFAEAMRQADAVILLEPPTHVRRLRIVRRWIRQNLGVEDSGYCPVPSVLRAMFRWTRNYDSGVDDLRVRLRGFDKKLAVLRTPKEIEAFLDGLPLTKEAVDGRE